MFAMDYVIAVTTAMSRWIFAPTIDVCPPSFGVVMADAFRCRRDAISSINAGTIVTSKIVSIRLATRRPNFNVEISNAFRLQLDATATSTVKTATARTKLAVRPPIARRQFTTSNVPTPMFASWTNGFVMVSEDFGYIWNESEFEILYKAYKINF